MAGIFKANNPFNTFLLFVYGIFLKLPWFLKPDEPYAGKMDGFLFKKILPQILLLKSNYTFLYFGIVYLLLFTQAVIFNRLVVNQRLLQKANYLPGMSYLLLTSLFTEWNQLSSVLVINTLMIWCFAKMNKLYNSHDPKVLLYNIGVIVGLCSFFYVPSIAFALLLAFALGVTRPLQLREWVVGVLGLITPYYFLFFAIFLSDDTLRNFRFPLLKPMLPVLHMNRMEWGLTGLLALITITGSYFIIRNLRKQIVQVRKCWTILLIYFIVAVLVSIFYSGKSLQYSLIALVPLSASMASYFFYPRIRLFLIAAHWLLVAFIIYTGFFIK